MRPDDVAIGFIDGACDSDDLLRHHILSPIKAALSPATSVFDLTRDDVAPAGVLKVSLFPNVPGDVLMMFDLADRNHFRQSGPDGSPFVHGFRKILVPGDWMRRKLVGDSTLKLTNADIAIVGAPRVDYLRSLAAAWPVKSGDGRLTVLCAPLHDNWTDRDDRPLSIRVPLEGYLDTLRETVDLRVHVDGRNKQDKRPITSDLLDADIVITDHTSLIFEAWALGKPVIFPRWLGTDRITAKAPGSAEGQIHQNLIGHHPETFDALLNLLAKGRDLDLGPGVDDFMSDYLANWRDRPSGPATARILEQLADPRIARQQKETLIVLDAAMKAKDWPVAEEHLVHLAGQDPNNAALYDKLAQVFKNQGKWWQELTALETLVDLVRPSAAQLNRLGIARQRMGRMQAAANAFEQAINLAPEKATVDQYYRLAYAFETEGTDGPPDLRKSAAAYKKVTSLDPAHPAATFGHGALHASAGRWREAQNAYLTRLAADPLNAELHYRLGMAYDRCYAWDAAEASYLNALALDTSKSAWHHRLGFVLERQEKFSAAAMAYAHAARLSKAHKPEYFYRAGYVLEKAGRLAEACDAFVQAYPDPKAPPAALDDYTANLARQRVSLIKPHLEEDQKNALVWAGYSQALEQLGDTAGAAQALHKAMICADRPNAAYAKRYAALDSVRLECRMLEARLLHNCTRAAEWFRYSTALEASGDLAGAISAMRQALLRSGDHMPVWHNRLGRLLVRQGDLESACAAFRDQQILQRPHGAYEDRFGKLDDLRETATYREFFDVLPIMPQTILYESFGGEGCSDNPLAIFNYVQNDARFKGWTHFWVVDDMSKAPSGLCSRTDVVFVLKGSTLYQRLLCTVEFLINNATFPFYYVRKEGQEYLNTWHGTPLKTLGYDIEATPLQRANTARNLIQSSMFIAPNTHTESVMLDRYGVRNLFTGRSLLTGYPRIDMLVNADDGVKSGIHKALGLDPSKPVVLFAPTYRGHWATPELEAQSLADTIERMKSSDYNLVFRGHYFAERFIMSMDLDVTIAPHAIDTCSLLSVVDVLVTDYSSIFYDFLITQRPVIHFVPDWDEYVATRGVYFGKDQLPGAVCETEEHLISLLGDCMRDPASQISPQYLADLQRYCAVEDGKASERVVDALFFNRTPPQQPKHADGAKHILTFGGDCQDGIQFSALQGMLSQMRDQGHISTVVVDRRAIIDDASRTANAQSILDMSDVIIRFGRTCFSLEETWINDKVKSPHYTSTSAMDAVFESAMRHEVKRLFGDARFDAVLDFDGRRPFWVNLMATTPAEKHGLCLPGDFARTSDQTSPELRRVTATLGKFDIIFSDSDLAHAANQSTLAKTLTSGTRFDVMPVIAAPVGRPEKKQKLADVPALQFLSKAEACLVGLPGADMAMIDRMLTLLGSAQKKRASLRLGLVVLPGLYAQVIQRFEHHPEWVNVTLISQSDPLDLFDAADCIVIGTAVEYLDQFEAEAARRGKPVLILAVDDDAKDAKNLGASLKSLPKIASQTAGAVKGHQDISHLIFT
ncbi:CDP-glycerol glycerophosphotransferase family protein [Loktanella sp. R86503]|uniref:CDP-glycerol glycerophosphotransferase family protein n=1 Tax=Loktanella sp. R86503 TaxID=3093847 RepID=UPI0036D97B27